MQPRAAQLCRVVLGVRLIVSVLAVLLLGSSVLSWRFAVAFAFAVVTSALAYLFSRKVVDLLQRHPILLGLDTFLSLFVLTLGGRAAPFVVFTVVTSAMAGLLYRWGGMLYIVVLQVVCYGAAVLAEVGAGNLASSQTLLAPALYYPLVGFAGVWIRHMLDDADKADVARQAIEISAAAERERTRLAGEMHDSLAKTVRGIALAAAALPSWIHRDPSRAVDEAGKIAAAAEVASREARGLLNDLRAGGLDQPLAVAIRHACQAWSQRTGVPVSLRLDDEVDLDVGARYEVVNIVKEALSNVERHARAGCVGVRLSPTEQQICLTIHDDGVGYDPDAQEEFAAAGHYGLLGMSERARRAGGLLELTSQPGNGSAVRLAVPHASDGRTTTSPPARSALPMETR